MTVSAGLAGMPLGDATEAAMALPAARAMPSGVELIEAGDAEIAAKPASGFGMASATDVLCMSCVLSCCSRTCSSQSPSCPRFRSPLGGAFVALLLAGSGLDVPSMIGLVMLMGIVTTNSILLVEYAVVGIRQRGLPMVDALVACVRSGRGCRTRGGVVTRV